MYGLVGHNLYLLFYCLWVVYHYERIEHKPVYFGWQPLRCHYFHNLFKLVDLGGVEPPCYKLQLRVLYSLRLFQVLTLDKAEGYPPNSTIYFLFLKKKNRKKLLLFAYYYAANSNSSDGTVLPTTTSLRMLWTTSMLATTCALSFSFPSTKFTLVP